jgi:hypothetical protein
MTSATVTWAAGGGDFALPAVGWPTDGAQPLEAKEPASVTRASLRNCVRKFIVTPLQFSDLTQDPAATTLYVSYR